MKSGEVQAHPGFCIATPLPYLSTLPDLGGDSLISVPSPYFLPIFYFSLNLPIFSTFSLFSPFFDSLRQLFHIYHTQYQRFQPISRFRKPSQPMVSAQTTQKDSARKNRDSPLDAPRAGLKKLPHFEVPRLTGMHSGAVGGVHCKEGQH